MMCTDTYGRALQLALCGGGGGGSVRVAIRGGTCT